MQVHSRAVYAEYRLGHKSGIDALLLGYFLDYKAASDDVVCGFEGFGIFRIDLVLAWRDLVMGSFHDNTHFFQGSYCLISQVISDVVGD